MVTADVNGDHRTDILIANSTSGTGSITLLTGRGDGTFEAETSVILSQPIGELAARDVNLDGKIDFVANAANQMLTMLGNGNGTFQSPLASPLTGSIGSFVLGRFNADTKPDVAIADPVKVARS